MRPNVHASKGSKHRKPGNAAEGSDFSPGIVAAGIWFVTIWQVTGDLTAWGFWPALVIMVIVDGLFGVKEEKIPKVKERRVYTRGE